MTEVICGDPSAGNRHRLSTQTTNIISTYNTTSPQFTAFAISTTLQSTLNTLHSLTDSEQDISALTISALGHFGTDRYGAGRFGASAVCDGSSNVTQPFLRLSDFLNMPILSYLILSYLILPGSLYI